MRVRELERSTVGEVVPLLEAINLIMGRGPFSKPVPVDPLEVDESG